MQAPRLVGLLFVALTVIGFGVVGYDQYQRNVVTPTDEGAREQPPAAADQTPGGVASEPAERNTAADDAGEPAAESAMAVAPSPPPTAARDAAPGSPTAESATPPRPVPSTAARSETAAPVRPEVEARAAPKPQPQAVERAMTPAPAPAERETRAEPDAAPPSATEPASPAKTGPPPAVTQAIARPPSFDIVRIEPDGQAVIAGRGPPEAEVEIRLGEMVIDQVKADQLGQWVSTPSKPIDPGDQALSLVARAGDTPPIGSKKVVVVAVPQRAAGAGLAPQPASTKPVAILVDRASGGEGQLLQAPGRLDADGKLSLMMIDYDEHGAIRLAGEAPPGAPIRIYIDNQPAGEVVGDQKGDWVTKLDASLAPGDYMLRLDQLDRTGRPVARLETPLTRVEQPPVEGELQVDYVVVQPGNSLWRIARRLSGNGFNYVYIFEANRTQIRDPDLIYPGQVFEVPKTAAAAG